MELYLLKSGLCLLICFIFYKLILEREKAHQTKRVYLLASLILAVLIPLITFTEIVEIPINEEAVESFSFQASSTSPVETPINYWLITLWSIYGLGVLIFSIRFLRNLVHIKKDIRQNKTLNSSFYTKVLMLRDVVPHTFFNFVFLNKAAHDNELIPREVLKHEEAHVRQKHSLDVLFLEVLQVVFWFNPLLYFFKKSIKLNHEFLADEAVIKTHAEPFTYQNILVNFSNSPHQSVLTSALNHSLTKKRILMLTKHSSRFKWLKIAAILPLLSVLIFSFSSKNVIQKQVTTTEQDVEVITVSENIEITVDADFNFKVNDISTKLNGLPSVLKRFNSHLTKEERSKFVYVNIKCVEEIPKDILSEIIKNIQNYGAAKIKVCSIDNQEVKTIDLVVTNGSIKLNGQSVTLENLTRRLNSMTNDWTKSELTNYKLNVQMALKNSGNNIVKPLNNAFKKSNLGKANPGKTFVQLPPPPPPSPIKSNDLDQYYDSPPPSPYEANPSLVKDIKEELKRAEKLKVNYSKREKELEKQVEEQEEQLEKHQQALEQQSKRLEKRAQKIEERSEKRLEIYNERLQEHSKLLKERAKLIEERNGHIEKLYINDTLIEVVEMEVNTPLPPLPPLPPPPNPQETVKKMAEKGASFYYEGKTITSAEALSIIQKNKDINILINQKDGLGFVKLSRSPVHSKEWDRQFNK